MNFIEALLEDIADVSAAEIIDVAMEKWGELDCPLDEGEHPVYPEFINDLLSIAYLDKAVHFHGLGYYILHSDKMILQNTVHAFRKINDNYDADLLQEVLEMDEVKQFYDSKIERFSESANDKFLLFESAMYFGVEQTNMWILLERYVEKEIYSYSMHTKNGYKN